jgi:hypothetical protein
MRILAIRVNLEKNKATSLPKMTILDKLKEMKYAIPTKEKFVTIRAIFILDPYLS